MSNVNLRIGLAPAMTKLSWGTSRDTAATLSADAPQEITVVGARNEVVGAQVHLAGQQDFVLTLDRSNWLHPSGFFPRVRLEVDFPTLPPDAVETFPVGYVEEPVLQPDPPSLGGPAEEGAEAPAEEGAEMPAEEGAEEGAEAPAEEGAEAPAEEGAEAPAEAPAEE